MYERFTMTSRIAVAAAARETYRLRGTVIGDEELLIGLATEPNADSVRLLDGLGVDRDSLVDELRQCPRHVGQLGASVRLPQTQEFRTAIQFSVTHVRASGQYRISTVHMLLGLLQQAGCKASRVVAGRSVTFDAAQSLLAAGAGEFALEP